MKTVKEDVKLYYNENSKEWRMKAKQETGPGNYEKLIVGKGVNGIFTFDIQTPHIHFDPANAIEFRLEGSGTDLSDQFMDVIIDGTKLVVADPNSDSALTEYYYKLNFISTHPTKPVPINPLDPVIQNGCCKSPSRSGVQLVSPTGLISVVVTAAVLASLYIAYVR